MDLTLLLLLGFAAVVLGALWVAARRAVTVAELVVERGTVRVARGGIAPPILGDLRDVASRPPIRALRIRILRASGRADVELVGEVSPQQAQRIRNVIGRVPLARLVNAQQRR